MTALIEQKTRSLTLAQAKMDEIRARSIYEYSTLYSQNSTTLGDSYLCTVVDTAMGSDLRNVEVTVGYDHDGDGILASDEIDVTLATLIARRW